MSEVINTRIMSALALGWSIIPLNGVGPKAKAPARYLHRWKQYQYAKANYGQISQWLAKSLNAYGIVMGKISGNLFAIDFDDRKLYKQFCLQFPQIAQSYSVQTRQGVHIYLYSHQNIRTMRFTGGDIIGEGSYVVGAGSQIRYQESNTNYVGTGGPIQTITEAQWTTIQSYLRIHKRPSPTKIDCRSNKTIGLQQKYKKLAPVVGRNNALYQIATQAKSAQIGIQQTLTALVKCHEQAPAPSGHIVESLEQRRQEAVRTIQSAYKTSGNTVIKPKQNISEHGAAQLPNSLREKLLEITATVNKQGQYIGASAILVRFIEAMNRASYLGTIIDKKELEQLAQKYKISKTSIEKILTSKNSKRIGIQRVSYSKESNPPPVGKGERKNYFHEMYQLPSLKDLMNFFKIVPKAVDVLADDDLYSNKRYLMAMHREFIKRSHADTSTAFCANRLCVTPRTLQNYDTALNIIKTEVIHYVPLTWQTVDDLIFSSLDNTGITPGIWIQNTQGQRFPATKGIALSRLKAQDTLILCTQKPSQRYLPDVAMIYHEVWWVAPDGTRWGGGAYDFPPRIVQNNLAELTANANSVAKTVSHPTITVPVHDSAQNHYQSLFEAQEQQRLKSIHKQVQHFRTKEFIQVNYHINSSLTLIKGIGNRIREELELVGIDLMTDLIAIGADSIADIFRYNQYISSHTTQKWIDQAELLLGLRKPRLEELIQQRAQKRQQILKEYRKMYCRLQVFVNQLVAEDEQQNIQLKRFKRRLDSWCEHPYLFTIHKFNEVKERVIEELESYLAHIQLLRDLEENCLERWALGSKTYWQKCYRHTQRHLNSWHLFSVEDKMDYGV